MKVLTTSASRTAHRAPRCALLCVLGCVLGLAPGCGPAPPAGVSARPPSFAGDFVVAPDGARRQALAPEPRSSGAVLYVDFLGDFVQMGASDSVDPEVSQIAPQPLQVPPFNSAIPAPHVSSADAELAIFDRLRTLYLPYDVTLTTTRPASPPYTMVLVGGSNSLFQNGVAAGIAQLDCGNTNPSNLAFDFADAQPPDYGGVVSVAITAAHESGHTFGLEHTSDPNDVMYSVANPAQSLDQLFRLGFSQTGAFSGYSAGESVSKESCGRADPVNAGVLAQVLGLRASVPSPPTLSWDFPPAGDARVPLTIPLVFTASPDTVRVEVYKNLDLVASLKSPPYRVSVTAAQGETFYLTAEAITALAARVPISRLYVAGAEVSPPCSDSSMCESGLTCVSGYCAGPMVQMDGGARPTDGGACDGACTGGGMDGGSSGGGCALGGRAGAGGGGLLIALALLALAYRLRGRGALLPVRSATNSSSLRQRR